MDFSGMHAAAKRQSRAEPCMGEPRRVAALRARRRPPVAPDPNAIALLVPNSASAAKLTPDQSSAPVSPTGSMPAFVGSASDAVSMAQPPPSEVADAPENGGESLAVEALEPHSAPYVNLPPARAPLMSLEEQACREAQWAQVLSALQSSGCNDRAVEYANLLTTLSERTHELMRLYDESVQAEEQLLQTAYQEAILAHREAQQVQATQSKARQAIGETETAVSVEQTAALYRQVHIARLQQGPQSKPRRTNAAPCQALKKHQERMELLRADGTGGLGLIAENQPPFSAPANTSCVQYCYRDSYGPVTEWKPGNPNVDANSRGLPIRPGENVCPFYSKTGSCRFGMACRWHHPELELFCERS